MRSPAEIELCSGSLCVVGNINRDVKASALPTARNLSEDGETSVGLMRETVGGGGANCACAAAALGAKVTFLGKVGSDTLGDSLERTLLANGVRARLKRGENQQTGTSINLIWENGNRHFVSCLPNNESLDLDDVDLTAIADHSHLYRADIWFSKKMLFGGNETLFKAARASNTAVSIDLNWDPFWGRASDLEIEARKDAVRSVLRWVTIAHGNIRELIKFADAKDLPDALSRLEKWGVEAVVVHMGAQGAGFYHRGKFVHARAARIKRRINSTGTGDVLSICMALLHRSPKLSIRRQLEAANRIVAEFIEGKRELVPQLQ